MGNETNKDELEESLKDEFTNLKSAYDKNRYPSLAQRKSVLLALKQSLIAHEGEFYQAFNDDYGHRSEFDSFVADILPSVMGMNYSLKRLRKWMKPSRRHAGIMIMPSRVEVQYQPLGVVGIITPWNFPVFLSLAPATQSIAAGNRVMIKLSEFTPNINKVLIKATECIREHLQIIEGDADTGAVFSALPFDHLVFTGSTRVGRYVAKAAANNLTPITLELGGKSPVIFTDNANWETSVDSVLLGKMMNSGQVCVSPDYVLVPRGKEEKFIQLFKQRYQELFLGQDNEANQEDLTNPENSVNPANSVNPKNAQTHIINQNQYDRLQHFLVDAKEKGAEIHLMHESGDVASSDSGSNSSSGNKTETRLLYPHLVTNVSDDMTLMQEEIFGSILPVLPYDSIDECIDFVNSRPRPLALYVMSTEKELTNKILRQTHSGGACVNDTVMQVIAEDAPFGGVGESGIGHYHGKEGFQRLSKAKTVVISKAWLPKNTFFLKNRELMMKLLRVLLLR